MAGDWIKVEKATIRKPEVGRIARALGVKRHHALGLLLDFWAWIDDVAVDGVVDGVVDADVDEEMQAPGFAAALMLVKWATFEPSPDGSTGRLTVPNPDRHFGESAKKRALKSDRQARWREGKRDATVDAGVDGHVDAHASLEKRREEKIEKTYPPPLAAAPVVVSSKKSPKATTTPLPAEFAVSDRVADWARDKGHTRLAEHLEYFIGTCRAKGYRYIDWDEAFMNAIRSNWAKLEAPRPTGGVQASRRVSL